MWAPSKSPWQAFGLGFGEGSHRQRSGPCGHFKVKELPGSSLRPRVAQGQVLEKIVNSISHSAPATDYDPSQVRDKLGTACPPRVCPGL